MDDGAVVQLLSRARRGDRAALGQLFELARAQLQRAASRSLPPAIRGRISPSDVVQETAIDVQRDFSRFKGSTAGELLAWLRALLNHNLIDAIRRHELTLKRSPRMEVRLGDSTAGREMLSLPGQTGTPESSAIRREDAAELHRTLAGLTDDHRTVLWLRYWRGMSFEEIAAQMRRSPGAVRKLWYRAMRCLNERIGVHSGALDDPPAFDRDREGSDEKLTSSPT